MEETFSRVKDQTQFLLEEQEKSKLYCADQFIALINFINKKIDVLGSGGDNSQVKQTKEISSLLDQHYKNFITEIDEDIDFLKQQLAVIDEMEKEEDLVKRKELVDILLDGEEILETVQFKADVLSESAESKKNFEAIVSDLKSAIEEGNVDEVFAYLQEMNEQEENEEEESDADMFKSCHCEEEESCCSGHCHSCGDSKKDESEEDDDND